jgi:hypothetical protein
MMDMASCALSLASCSSPVMLNSSGFLSLSLVNSVSSRFLNLSSSI